MFGTCESRSCECLVPVNVEVVNVWYIPVNVELVKMRTIRAVLGHSPSV